ncbi:low molecular weight phosphotyrosine protein phosphatase [Vibrio sp. RE86]|uniref:low molecular weight protein-tyrosine-phosphatase n=1 Tax=Vibrio sp. RE86 TaxID=2607605 RepID=UPI001493AE3B|nr:low molecular weight protein-tyrosine-phosphatase [Vibrio sp. RE86]NOH80439.1 low molecular weight phosphotyrosine protein phosphatase [Vibrio sp. RE86]
MFNKILVVCMGNVCRSPMGEGVLKKLLPNKQVRSAGLVTDKSGLANCKAAPISILVAKEHDIDIQAHRATQVTAEMCNQADLILVMEQSHIERLTRISPTSRSKTLLFGQWSGDGTIDDPYQKDQQAFLLAFQRIQNAAEAWARRLEA